MYTFSGKSLLASLLYFHVRGTLLLANFLIFSRENPEIRFLDTISDNKYLAINNAGDFVFKVNVTGEFDLSRIFVQAR